MVGTTHSYLSHCLLHDQFPPPSAPCYQVQHCHTQQSVTYTGHSDVCTLGRKKGVCMCALRCTVYTFPIGPVNPPPFFLSLSPLYNRRCYRYQTAVDRAIRGKAFESDIPRPSQYIEWRQSTTNCWSVVLI